MDECLICKTRATLKQAEKIIDEAPVINSPLYDDAIADLMNNISNAISLFSCYCQEEEAKQ